MAGGEGVIVAGVGLRRGCPADAVVALVEEALARAGCRLDVLAGPAFKRDEAGLSEAARRLAVPLVLVEAEAMRAVEADCPTRSAAAARATGFASVAESVALGAAGPGAKLMLPRIASADATCAIAGGQAG